MYTLRRIAAVPIATIGLFTNGCVSPADTYPDKGIVVTKLAEEVTGDCTFSSNNICMVYDDEMEYSVTIADCRRSAGGIIAIANEDYLRSHLEHPSDYPIVSSSFIDFKEEGKRFCQDKVIIEEEQYQDIQLGTLFTRNGNS